MATPVNGERRVFYEELRAAIAEAKTKVGAELTTWRDAVGKSEVQKEKKQAPSESDEDEEEVDERDV